MLHYHNLSRGSSASSRPCPGNGPKTDASCHDSPPAREVKERAGCVTVGVNIVVQYPDGLCHDSSPAREAKKRRTNGAAADANTGCDMKITSRWM